MHKILPDEHWHSYCLVIAAPMPHLKQTLHECNIQNWTKMSKMYNIYLYIYIYISIYINLYKGKSGTLVIFFFSQILQRKHYRPWKTTQSGELITSLWNQIRPWSGGTDDTWQHRDLCWATCVKGMSGSGESQLCADTETILDQWWVTTLRIEDTAQEENTNCIVLSLMELVCFFLQWVALITSIRHLSDPAPWC